MTGDRTPLSMRLGSFGMRVEVFWAISIALILAMNCACAHKSDSSWMEVYPATCTQGVLAPIGHTLSRSATGSTDHAQVWSVENMTIWDCLMEVNRRGLGQLYPWRTVPPERFHGASARLLRHISDPRVRIELPTGWKWGISARAIYAIDMDPVHFVPLGIDDGIILVESAEIELSWDKQFVFGENKLLKR